MNNLLKGIFAMVVVQSVSYGIAYAAHKLTRCTDEAISAKEANINDLKGK